jgi:hypothetical protein
MLHAGFTLVERGEDPLPQLDTFAASVVSDDCVTLA